MKELLVFDLDGTLVNERERISELTRFALQQLDQLGVNWTVATGRMPHGVPLGARDTLAGLALRHPQAYKNGVLIWDLQQDVHFNHFPMAPDELAQVCVRLQRAGINFWLNTLDHNHQIGAKIRELTNDRERRWSAQMALHDIEVQLHDNLPDVSEYVLNVSAITDNVRALDMAEELSDLPGVEVFAGPAMYDTDHYWMDIHHVHGNKGDAVRFIQEQVGAERLVCFGDSDNDLSMFRQADEAYAMGNAIPELQAEATGIIRPNSEEGIAHFLATRYGFRLP